MRTPSQPSAPPAIDYEGLIESGVSSPDDSSGVDEIIIDMEKAVTLVRKTS